MLRGLQNSHLRPRLDAIKVTTTSAPAASIEIGSQDFSSIETSFTGDFTLTPLLPYLRTPVLVGTPMGDAEAGSYFTNTTIAAGSQNSMLNDAAGSLTAGSANVLLFGHRSADTVYYKNPLQSVLGSARNPRLMAFRVTSAAAIGVGGSQATVSKASSVYTLAFKRGFSRTPIVVATPIAAAQKAIAIQAAANGTAQIKTLSSAEAAEDNSFYCLVYGWDSTSEQGGLSRVVHVPQIQPRILGFTIDDTGAVVIGSGDGTAVKNSTGDYTVTFTKAFAREPIVIVSGVSGRAQVKAAASASSVEYVTFGATGTLTDDYCSMIVVGYDSATEV